MDLQKTHWLEEGFLIEVCQIEKRGQCGLNPREIYLPAYSRKLGLVVGWSIPCCPCPFEC